MSPTPKIAVNPLPWFSPEPGDWDHSAGTVAAAVAEIPGLGFTAMQADLPEGMGPAEFLAILAERGVRPAPSYWAPVFDCPPDAVAGYREEAKRRAAEQTALGLTEIVLADELYPVRIAAPATAAGFDSARLERVIERIGAVATALTDEGITPCFHQHVASWIESEREVRALLDAVGASVLSFCPDFAHLAWAGADVLGLCTDYADRIGAIHLKDIHFDGAGRARSEHHDWDDALFVDHVFTEPGRGDLDLEAIVAAVPDDFDGWWISEVDVPDLPTREESTRASAAWLADYL